MLSTMAAEEVHAKRRAVAGYTRISRVGGRRGDAFISKDDQQEGIIARAAALGLSVEEWFHDPDYSGGNLQRPEWERLMARVLDPDDPICGVVVVRVDRFARTVPEGAPEVKRIWDSNGRTGVFVAADLPLDSTTPHGRKMLWDWLSNAELFLEMTKAGWWRAKRRAIARGAHIGTAPLAFSRIPKNADRDAGKLVPKPEWVPCSRAIFDYAKRHPEASEATISRWANEHARRPDGRQWTPTTIGDMLRNRTYIGEIAYRPLPDGRSRSSETFEPMVNPRAHEGIVDEATFLAAQRTRRRPRTQAQSRAERVAMLRGLCRCAGCRHTLIASRGGKNTPVYRCTGRFVAGPCPAPTSIAAHIIEPWVLGHVRAQLADVEAVGEFVTDADPDADALAAIERERAVAHDDLRTITENTSLAAADPDGWIAVRRAALVRANELDERYVVQLQSQRSPVATILGGTFTWEDITDEELGNVLLPEVIDCVFVRSGRGVSVDRRALILWRGQAEDDLPGSGRPWPTIRSFQWPEDEPVAGVP